MSADAREARLPKWAQQELRTLRYNLASAMRALDADPASTLRASFHGNDRYLDPESRVTWTLGDPDDQVEVTAVQQRRDGADVTVLRLMARHGRIVASPGGGVNVINIYGDDR